MKNHAPYLIATALLGWLAYLVLWIARDPQHGGQPLARGPK